MKRTMVRASTGILAALSLAANASAGCVPPADMAALETAAMQQELMVAAFSCHDIDLYNRFVRAHQPELIQSDARLKAYFVQRDGAKRGEADYHSYKTELANASSLVSLQDDGFCDRAGGDFGAADRSVSLIDALGVHPWTIETIYGMCPGRLPVMADASVEAPPPRTDLPAVDDTRSSRYARPRWQPDSEAFRAGGPRVSEIKTPSPHRSLEGSVL